MKRKQFLISAIITLLLALFAGCKQSSIPRRTQDVQPSCHTMFAYVDSSCSTIYPTSCKDTNFLAD